MCTEREHRTEQSHSHHDGASMGQTMRHKASSLIAAIYNLRCILLFVYHVLWYLVLRPRDLINTTTRPTTTTTTILEEEIEPMQFAASPWLRWWEGHEGRLPGLMLPCIINRMQPMNYLTDKLQDPLSSSLPRKRTQIWPNPAIADGQYFTLRNISAQVPVFVIWVSGSTFEIKLPVVHSESDQRVRPATGDITGMVSRLTLEPIILLHTYFQTKTNYCLFTFHCDELCKLIFALMAFKLLFAENSSNVGLY